MIQLRMGKNFEATAHRSALGIVGAVHDPRHACLDDGSGAHGAGLNRDIQRGAHQAVIVGGARSFAQGDNFGVRRRIAIADGAVVSACD